MPSSQDQSTSLWKGAAAGLAAGLVASLVMDRFQALVTAASGDDQQGEPSTQQAADRLSQAATGRPVAEAYKGLAGNAVHYTLGAVLGVAYGMTAEVRPEATAGGGTLFGTGVAGLLDEAAVPAVGLGDAPWQTPLPEHAYTLVSHLVFGAAAEAARRLVRGALN